MLNSALSVAGNGDFFAPTVLEPGVLCHVARNHYTDWAIEALIFSESWSCKSPCICVWGATHKFPELKNIIWNSRVGVKLLSPSKYCPLTGCNDPSAVSPLETSEICNANVFKGPFKSRFIPGNKKVQGARLFLSQREAFWWFYWRPWQHFRRRF